MSNSVSEELTRVKKLLNEFKLEKTLQLVKDIEQRENLSPEEMLRTKAYKCEVHFNLGYCEIAFKIAEQ